MNAAKLKCDRSCEAKLCFRTAIENKSHIIKILSSTFYTKLDELTLLIKSVLGKLL